MYELVVSEMIKNAVRVASDILSKRVEKLNYHLEKNRRSNSTKLKLVSKADYRAADRIRFDAALNMEHNEAQASVASHLSLISDWSSSISFKDLRKEREFTSSYVDLDTYLMPRNSHVDKRESSQTRQLISTITDETKHVVVLGTPGAGKTTSMKKLCRSVLEAAGEAHRPNGFPILIRFRTLNYRAADFPILRFLESLFKVEIDFHEADLNEISTITMEVLCGVLDSLDAILILEGFDEIPTPEGKNRVLHEIREMAERLSSSKMILTCRTGEFPYDVPKVREYEIAPLNGFQIRKFARKWLGSECNDFVSQVKNSPYYDATIRPLALAHLCAIYKRIGRIPSKPKTMYRKLVSLLLDDWDQQRSIIRQSAYANFETDEKFEFLSNLAFQLTIDGILGEFDSGRLAGTYLLICAHFGLPKSKKEAIKVATEIEGHTGLFVRCGFDSYEFAHKSIQEYLTAEYLVRLPGLSKLAGKLDQLGAELAVATAISSDPNFYFSNLILNHFNTENRLTAFFLYPFLSRLMVERSDITSCEEVTLALLHIIGHPTLDEETEYLQYNDFIRPLLPKAALRSLKKYYSIESRDVERGVLKLTRVSSPPSFRLKAVLEPKILYDEIIEAYGPTLRRADRLRD